MVNRVSTKYAVSPLSRDVNNINTFLKANIYDGDDPPVFTGQVGKNPSGAWTTVYCVLCSGNNPLK